MNTLRGRKSSSYFPESEKNTEIQQKACTDQNYKSPPVQLLLHCDLTFPSTTTVLWDRSPVGRAVYLHASDIIPSVLLVASNVRSILSALSEISSADTVDCRVTVAHRTQLLENEQAVASRPYTGTPYVTILRVSETELHDFGKASCTLTVPIQKSDTDRLSPTLEGSSTRSLLVNLGKAIRKGREFTLKSCMRMRASGHVTSASPGAGDLNSSLSLSLSSGTNGWARHYGDESAELSGTLRMEAIVPNQSFRAMPVMAAPIADSVVTKQLLSRGKSGMFEFTPKLGYLTMNATRHLIPLLEAGADVIHTPLVGLWVKFEEAAWCTQLLERGEVEQVLRHPFVWGACVRFLCSEYAPLKPTLEQNMFRLLLVIGGQAFHYEMAVLQASRDHNAHSPGASLRSEEDFLCANFTVDLATESTQGLNPAERAAAEAAMGVVCAFRPLSRPEQVENFHRAAREAAVTSPGGDRSQPHSPQGGLTSSRPHAGFTPTSMSHVSVGAVRSSLRTSVDGGRRVEAASTDSTASSLAPRRFCPRPAPAPRSPAAGTETEAGPVKQSRQSSQHGGVGTHSVQSLRMGPRPDHYSPPRASDSPLPRPVPSPAHATTLPSASASLLRPLDQYEYLTGAFAGSREVLQRQQELELRMYDTQQLVLSLQRELQESRQYIAQLEHRLYSAGSNTHVVTQEESLLAANFLPVQARSGPSAAAPTSAQQSADQAGSFLVTSSARTEATQQEEVSVQPLQLDTSAIEESYRSPRDDDYSDRCYEDEGFYSEQSSFADRSAIADTHTKGGSDGSQGMRESLDSGRSSRATGVRDSMEGFSGANSSDVAALPSSVAESLAQAAPPMTPAPPPAATGVVKGNTATALSLTHPPQAPRRGGTEQRSTHSTGSTPSAEASQPLVGNENSSLGRPPTGPASSTTTGAGNRWAETTFVESESILQIQARYS